MEKIIGGIELENPFPARIRHKILWPCYEFIASAEGLDDFEKNIIEEVFLKLAEIGVTGDSEIEACTALDLDLISFMRSRLQQKGWLYGTGRLTDDGRAKLDLLSEKKPVPVRVYVDALTGRVIPHIAPVSDKNAGEFRYGSPEFKKEKAGECEKEANLFLFKNASASAGTEREEKQVALQLQYDTVSDKGTGSRAGKFNQVPSEDDVTSMLHRLFPKKDGIFVRIDAEQNCKKNLRWIMLDLLLPEGDLRNWVCTDGFGHLSSFFSVDDIPSETDKAYITNLRKKLQSGTNAKADSASISVSDTFPQIGEKIEKAQKSMKELAVFADSPDKTEALRSAENDAVLYVTQFAEWTFFYLLRSPKYAYASRNELSRFDGFRNTKNSDHIIGEIAAKTASYCGFGLDNEDKKGLRERYGRIEDALKKTPSLIALIDLSVCTLKDEAWFRSFAKEHGDFVTNLLNLNHARNRSFHSGGTGLKESRLRLVYDEIISLLSKGLGVNVSEKSEISFAEKVSMQNERNSAIASMESDLGFTLCHTLEPNLLRFYTDMSRRSQNPDKMDNAVVLDVYRILETVFVQVNESLGDELKNSDWKAKTRASGMTLDGNECRSLLCTNPERIKKALRREPSSMGAACIAFLTLSDEPLLRELKNKWRNFPCDVSYIVRLRGHGEIPDKIDNVRVREIKTHITGLIHFFAKKGFLTR